MQMPSVRSASVAQPRRFLALVTTALLALLTVLASVAPAQAASSTNLPRWKLLNSGSAEHFRGLAAVSSEVAWLGGYDGTVLRTIDGGRTWTNVSPAGAGTLQFRDISATDASHAVAMAAGEGTDSRLYVTSDGGASWQLAYQNTDPAAFFDCMSFYNPHHGLVLSDPVDGKFRILATHDGGNTWQVVPNGGMPAARNGEFGFAASGECLTTHGSDAWFGAGGTPTSRIFHSRDGGRHWSAISTPIVSGPSAGVFGLAFRTRNVGVAVGGDFAAPSASASVAAYTNSAQGPWVSAQTMPHGYRSGVAFETDNPDTVLSVGLTGSDISFDDGHHWTQFGHGQFDTVACTSDGACWASGDLGRVAVLRPRG